MLRLAASLERSSEHPLAEAIVSAAKADGLILDDAQHFDSKTGRGIVGEVEGRKVAVGSPTLLRELGIDAATALPHRDELSAVAKTLMLVAIDGQVAGLLAVADPIKDSSRRAVEWLRGMGLEVGHANR